MSRLDSEATLSHSALIDGTDNMLSASLVAVGKGQAGTLRHLAPKLKRVLEDVERGGTGSKYGVYSLLVLY